MVPGLSTYVFFDQRLRPGLLDALASAARPLGRGITIEVFAARHHFDYTDPQALRETAAWFRSNDVTAVLHQPIYLSDRADAQWSRHVAPDLNLISRQKTQRIAAMDEVKRALEAAEKIPFNAAVLHLGERGTPWDEPAIEYSLTAIEHLKAFAAPLGLRLLLENLQNEVATPEHLLYILKAGHFDTVGVSLDLGHLHLTADAGPDGAADAAGRQGSRTAPPIGSMPTKSPLVQAIAVLGERVAQMHLHDNHGPFGSFSTSTEMHAEHLWPGEGTIDWDDVRSAMLSLPPGTPGILEPAPNRDLTPAQVTQKAEKVFRELLDPEPVQNM